MKHHPRLLGIILVAASVAFSGAARADDITIDPHPFISSASRAAVKADLQAFKRAGVDPWAQNYDPLRSFQSSRTRAQVSAEYIRNRSSVAEMNGEDSGAVHLSKLRRAVSPPVYLADVDSPEAIK